MTRLSMFPNQMLCSELKFDSKELGALTIRSL